jgi:NAD(P)-dependent dehydrogenase (short-subunit alcohol dehydrogenase family)
MRSVVVTGVSTGIGHASAQVLLDKGYRVFGSVRNMADAERLSREFGAGFTPLHFDITDEAAVKECAAQVRDALNGETLAGLVNNAGIAVAGPLLELPVQEFRRQLEVNLVGTFIVTQAFAPLLGADTTLRGDPGRIVNISSMAGVRALPFLGPYSASKFGLEGYSESLRRELLLYGIDVIVIGPGPVKTPIWDKAETVDTAAYQNSPYAPLLEKFRRYFGEQGRNGYPAELIGDLVHQALTLRKPKPRYAAVKGRLLEKLLMNIASKRMLDRVIGKSIGLLPPLRERTD